MAKITPKHRYGIVLDAGSSGTRIYVYKWETTGVEDRLPHITTHKKWRMKVHPGISSVSSGNVATYLQPLLDLARDVVPPEQASQTPIFLLATAGMRLLAEEQSNALLEETCSFLKTSSFWLPDCNRHVRIIPGETEGLYGWIAANYLLGGLDAGNRTFGFLDMGGASAQIAFAPNATESAKHSNDLTLLRLRTMAGKMHEYRIFITTWLGFGANEARRRYVDGLKEATPEGVVLDPCLPVGLSVDGLEGTGQFAECLNKTYPLLEKDTVCLDEPCLINGQHTPAVDFGINRFVGVSEYWHTTHDVFAKDKAFDLASYQKQAHDFCSRDWKDIMVDVGEHKWGKKVDNQTVANICFKASWVMNMLHEGIGIPRMGLETSPTHKNTTKAVLDQAAHRGFIEPFQAIDEIDGTEVSWTLGKIVIYASSFLGTGVGFGQNPVDGGPVDDLAQGMSLSLFQGRATRRVPGLAIFIVMLVLAIWLALRGRRRKPVYERVLEEAEVVPEVELEPFELSGTGRASGWATPNPTLHGLSPLPSPRLDGVGLSVRAPSRVGSPRL